MIGWTAAWFSSAVVCLYASIYQLKTENHALHLLLAIVAVALFASAPVLAPSNCRSADSLLRFACGCGLMKALEMYARRGSPPKAKYDPINENPKVYAWYLLSELRYESFNISTVKLPPYTFSEKRELLKHMLLLLSLQLLPQANSLVKAFSILLSIYCIWTAMGLGIRYTHSEPLFGPIYKARNLTGFWTETWHNAFTAPCLVLAYRPVYKLTNNRVFATLAAFVTMGVWHTWSLQPLVSPEAQLRILLFFVLNGVGTIADNAVWGPSRNDNMLRRTFSWAWCAFLAQWTASACAIPNGIHQIQWSQIC